MSVLDAALAAVAEAPLHLLLNQGRQIGFVGPTVACGRLRLRAVVLMERRQLQLL